MNKLILFLRLFSRLQFATPYSNHKPLPYTSPKREGQMKVICQNCGQAGVAEKTLKGHFLITLILLLCYVLPGIVYMIWRRTGLKNRCAKCHSENLVPEGSAVGRELISSRITPDTHVKCPDCRELVFKDARKCKHCGTALAPLA